MIKQRESYECEILPLDIIVDNAKKLPVDQNELINYYVFQLERENTLFKLTANDVKFINGMAIIVGSKLKVSPDFYNYLISDYYQNRVELFLKKYPKNISAIPLFIDENGRKINHKMLQELLFDVCVDPDLISILLSTNTKSLIRRKRIIDEHIRYNNHISLINAYEEMQRLSLYKSLLL